MIINKPYKKIKVSFFSTKNSFSPPSKELMNEPDIAEFVAGDNDQLFEFLGGGNATGVPVEYFVRLDRKDPRVSASRVRQELVNFAPMLIDQGRLRGVNASMLAIGNVVEMAELSTPTQVVYHCPLFVADKKKWRK